jgi:hypothetical protein
LNSNQSQYNLPREKFFRAILFRIYLGTDIYRQKLFLAVQHSFLSLKITLGLAPSCNFLATNTRVSGLLEKISSNISVPWYCNDLNTLLFRQIFEPAQNGNKCVRDRHRIGGALRCVFLLAEKVRNAKDEGSSWKSAANKTHMLGTQNTFY